MSRQPLVGMLTAFNLMLLIVVVADRWPIGAQQDGGVLRGRALELVDERGRVRAEIKVLPADPKVKMPDGSTGYPETVQLRLFSSQGAPNVKLGTTEDGSGLVLGNDLGYIQLLSRHGDPFVKIVTKDGREQVMSPRRP